MKNEDQATLSAATSDAASFATSHDESDGLLGRIEVIEGQPLEQRAMRYDQFAEELLSELQRSDHESAE